MLNFSFSELLLLAVLALVFIGPKELPGMVRALAKALKQVKALADELRQAFNELARESGLEEAEKEFTREMRTITGDDGREYEAYDISDMMGEDDGQELLPKDDPARKAEQEPKDD